MGSEVWVDWNMKGKWVLYMAARALLIVSTALIPMHFTLAFNSSELSSEIRSNPPFSQYSFQI